MIQETIDGPPRSGDDTVSQSTNSQKTTGAQTATHTDPSRSHLTTGADTVRVHPNATFKNLKAEVSDCTLPNWHVCTADNVIQLSLLKNSPPEPAVVKVSVTVSEDLQWTASVHGKRVPVSNI